MRAAQNDPMVNIVAVNDPFIPTNYMEYMFAHDTTHGKYAGDVKMMNESSISIDGKPITVFDKMDPKEIQYKIGDQEGVHPYQ